MAGQGARGGRQRLRTEGGAPLCKLCSARALEVTREPTDPGGSSGFSRVPPHGATSDRGSLSLEPAGACCERPKRLPGRCGREAPLGEAEPVPSDEQAERRRWASQGSPDRRRRGRGGELRRRHPPAGGRERCEARLPRPASSMDLRLQKQAFWASLHLRGSNLQSWALGRELALGTTCDQLPQGGGRWACWANTSEADLWMWVNPNLVCPVPGGRCSAAEEVLLPLGPLPAAGPEGSCSAPACLGEDDLLPLPSGAEKVTQEEGDASLADPPPPQKAEGICGAIPRKAHPRKAMGVRCRGRKRKRAQGGWPRPPLNYCLLICLALRSGVDSSLTVQEIYQFTRQHFPFFRTAPVSWKSTVRHYLCFSSSFAKTTDLVYLEGNRKLHLWRLTSEGQRTFQEEARALPEDMMGLVQESMERPELMRSLFGL